MKELSAGILTAWQIAVIETKIAKHQFIEKEQIIIGICSLEKVLTSRRLNLNFNDRELQEIRLESESIEAFLSKFKLSPTILRRELRKNCGQGNFKHIEKVIHRSEECKEYFKRSELLAENLKKVGCLHLFAAIMENPTGVIKKVIKDRDIKPIEIQKKALFFARISQKGNKKDSYII